MRWRMLGECLQCISLTFKTVDGSFSHLRLGLTFIYSEERKDKCSRAERGGCEEDDSSLSSSGGWHTFLQSLGCIGVMLAVLTSHRVWTNLYQRLDRADGTTIFFCLGTNSWRVRTLRQNFHQTVACIAVRWFVLLLWSGGCEADHSRGIERDGIQIDTSWIQDDSWRWHVS